MVRLSTSCLPRRWSLTISFPSTLIKGEMFPSWRIRWADFRGDEVPVGEDLEVAIGVLGQNIQQ